MFGHRFFGARFFAPRYFGDGGTGGGGGGSVDLYYKHPWRRRRKQGQT